MDSNPICQPSPAKKMKCSFLDFVQFLMISQAGQWTQTPSATPLQPKKWNAHFWIMFNFWWLAGLVEGLEPHLPPLSTQKTEILIFRLRSSSDDWPGLSMDGNSHLPPLSSQKHEILLFGIRSTSDDQPRWSMDSNPILHLSPAKKVKCSFLFYIQHLMLARLVNGLEPHPPPVSSQKMKCSFLGYIQLLMISQAGRWTQTLSATPLLPKKWNAHFWIMFNFWWSARLVDELKPHSPPLSSQKNEMLIFGLCSTSHDFPG